VTVRVGITGVSGYGGRELLRLCAGHPAFEVVYACGDSSAGKRLDAVLPQLAGHPLGALPIQRFQPGESAGLDVLFASLPTGQSREPLAQVPAGVRVVDVGGDHRFAPGWTYGLTELPGARREIAGAQRVADPGCYPATALLALAPLVAGGLVEPEGVVIDAKSGISGATATRTPTRTWRRTGCCSTLTCRRSRRPFPASPVAPPRGGPGPRRRPRDGEPASPSPPTWRR
jgi:N-acetyl-gamma-glutamyl-phosphate reductase